MSAELSSSPPLPPSEIKLDTSTAVPWLPFPLLSPPETMLTRQTISAHSFTTQARCYMVSTRTVREQRRHEVHENLRSKENNLPQHLLSLSRQNAAKPLARSKNARVTPSKISRPLITPLSDSKCSQPKIAEHSSNAPSGRILRTERRSISPVSQTRLASVTQVLSATTSAQKHPLRAITNTSH